MEKGNNNEYGDKPRYTKTVDSEGRVYYVGYTNKVTESVRAIDDVVTVYEGQPIISLRKGKSVFNEQIIFGFLYPKQVRSYRMRGNHDTFENYLPKGMGVAFLRGFLDYVSKDDDDDEKKMIV